MQIELMELKISFAPVCIHIVIFSSWKWQKPVKAKVHTECPIWKEHYFEAVYRAEFSTHFVGTYRKLKPKDVQIDW